MSLFRTCDIRVVIEDHNFHIQEVDYCHGSCVFMIVVILECPLNQNIILCGHFRVIYQRIRDRSYCQQSDSENDSFLINSLAKL